MYEYPDTPFLHIEARVEHVLTLSTNNFNLSAV